MSKIKASTKKAIRVAGRKAKSVSSKSVSVAKKASTVSVKVVKKVPATKTYKKAKSGYKSAHKHIAEKPHESLMRRSRWYAWWHSWQYKRISHKHIHFGMSVAWLILVVFIVGSYSQGVSAMSAWIQSDWSGGVGQSTVNQYESKTDIDASSTGLSITPTDKLTNGGFESGTDGWKLSSARTGIFEVGSYSTTSANPSYVVAGDFNNDGNVDVAASSNASAGAIVIHLGNGGGTFGGGVDYPVGAAPMRINTADIDHDGKLDLVSANYSDNTISLLLGNGDGTFGSKINYPVGINPRYIQIADINNDGKLDLLIANYNGGSVSLLLGNGDGTFQAKPDAVTSYRPFAISTGDFNNDGKLDLAVPTIGSNLVSVLMGKGDGTFDSKVDYATDVSPRSISTGDFNNDGKLDLATSNLTSNNVSVLMGNGDGTFDSKVDYVVGTQPADIKIADLNNDGKLDLATSNSTSNNVSVLMGNGDGTFSTKNDYTVGSGSISLVIVDADKDGNADIITADPGNKRITVLLNKGEKPLLVSDETNNNSAQSIKINATNNDTTLSQLASASGKNVLSAYVYVGGSVVDTNKAQLSAGGVLLPTTYAVAPTAGWYELSATISGTDRPIVYGVTIKAPQQAYVDDINLRSYGSGQLTSAIKDVEYGALWGALEYTHNGNGNIDVRVRSSNDSNMAGSTSFADCAVIANGAALTGSNCMHDNDRYVQYQITLTGQNGETPTLQQIKINYTPYDVVPPDVNASNVIMKRSINGDIIESGEWTNNSKPYFEWTAGHDQDTGLKGYCLYLGKDESADPATTKGFLGDSPVSPADACPFVVSDNYIDTGIAGYLATTLETSSDRLYFNIKAIDKTNNIYNGLSSQFSFRFDDIPPENPKFISAPSQFVANKEVTLTWPTTGKDAASDLNSGLAGLQYNIGDTKWYGTNHIGSESSDDLLVNNGSYTTVDSYDFENIKEGNNIVSFRTWDQAGNVSSVYTTTVIRLNTTSPSSPQNLLATPPSNTVNNFAFSWAAPGSFQGAASGLSYCYTINTLPSQNTCSFTPSGVTSLPTGAYATQPGDNTFYAVARDEAGNINYATASSITFTANTSAPGVPIDVDVVDVSVRATASWKLAIAWEKPISAGAGIAAYRVERSIDNSNYTQVATTAGTSYVDNGLQQRRYYYRIKACDSANNCGASSLAVSATPTGKFTEPAVITAQPTVSGVSTRKAIIKWATNRASDSRIAIGTRPGHYEPFQIASSQQVTDHSVALSNLSAGTTYFTRATWTDEDGNIGTASEISFKTEPAPSTQDVAANRVGLTTAQISFTSVSATKVVIQYGKSDSFGGQEEILTSLSKSTYNIELTGLDDGAKYVYRLNTYDAEGNEYTGGTVLSFTTPARPRINNLRFQPIEGEPTSTQKITWATNVPASSSIRLDSKGLPTKEISNSKLVTEHEVIIKDLLDDTAYSLVAQSRDAGGNLAVSDAQTLHTALDTRPPKVTDITIETTIRGTGSEARGQIIVSWKTDEPAASQVAYGEGSQVKTFNNKTAEDTALATEHIVIVSDLPPSRVYSVQPISRDRANNIGVGDTQSAIIGRASDNILTIVLGTLKKVFGF